MQANLMGIATLLAQNNSSIWTLLNTLTSSNPMLFNSTYPFTNKARVLTKFWWIAEEHWLVTSKTEYEGKLVEDSILVDLQQGAVMAAQVVPTTKNANAGSWLPNGEWVVNIG